MSNELTERTGSLVPEDDDCGEALGQMIQKILAPTLEMMARLIQNSTEAVERVAATQKIQTDRLEAIERQIRLNTPISKQQEKYLNDAIRAKARELLLKRSVEDDKATRKLAAAIRKSVLARYGIASMREIPKHEYSVAMSQINLWNDALCVRDAVKEARWRNEGTKGDMGRLEPAADMDGQTTVSGTSD